MAKNHEIETQGKAHVLSGPCYTHGQVTERLLNGVGERKGARLVTLKGRMAKAVALPKHSVRSFEEHMLKRVQLSAGMADRYVHENPWQIIGLVASFCFMLGLFMG